jgi:hypothetical protein
MQIIVFSFTIHYSTAEDDHAIHAAGKYTHPLFHLTPLPPIAHSASFSLALIPLHLIPTRNLKLIPQRRSKNLPLSLHPSQIMKLHHPYIYQSHANILSQDVFASHGPANNQKLKDISKKSDPECVWERGVGAKVC